ncbi:hypothetical protein HDC90_000257 [Pedobacter sp. AK013]|uniref:RagB/SusD family nutrient uptake outer membrane protein n=1 Tax=Pedobacter sp. AK013 TaxID=2723071 RepID=UPI001621EDAE|nr:RagB/SusD family nutrient uptake outer membrane protein [Pedobacter sp. AK013]MBB6235660.1 hypothetical protein [Pedobacter sp. AK013]
MKKLVINILLAFFLVLSISCKKVLEDHPLNVNRESDIWDQNDATGTNAQAWVIKIYSQLPNGFIRLNGMELDCAAGDGVPSNRANAVWNVINGGYNSINTFDDNWANSYSAIRRANIFLNNYKRVPWSDPTLPKWLAAEVRTLRAYFYYEMIRRYGGVPLLGEKVYNPDDPALLQLKRSSFATCVDYIVSELDAVKDQLRPDVSLASRGSGNGVAEGTDNDAGRMRPTINMAIKAKVLLLAASPLFNPSATPALDFTGYASFDANRWKAAADAMKAVMDLNMFALEPNRYVLNTTHVNKEFVFMRYAASYQITWGNLASPVGYTVGNVVSGGIVSPTQELVDAFPMANGKAIADPTSGYNLANPYTNRDPRLAQTVFYNGATWLRRPVQTYEGGLDKPNNTNIAGGVQTQTGYYQKKFLAQDDNNTAFTPTMYHPSGLSTFCLIRYADILLNYAEAQNEFAGPDATVYAAVNAVRQRAGLNPFAAPIGLSKEQMRSLIQNECRLEFAFEERRFYDIRRWKIAKEVYGTGSLHGVNIVKNADGSLIYTPITVATPFFNANNMYLLPIANSEILANPNIAQNPNY